MASFNPSSSSGMGKKVQIVECSGGELIVNTENLQNLIQAQISNGFGDYRAIFIGFIGSPQSGKSFAASLAQNQCSSQESNIAESVMTALQQTKPPQEAHVTSGISLWEQPILVANENGPINIWLVEFNCTGVEPHLNLPLIHLAKLICTRIVETVLDEKTILISPSIFVTEGQSLLEYYCWSILYITDNSNNSMAYLQTITNYFSNHLGIPTKIAEMILLQDAGNLDDVAITSFERCISEIVHIPDISQAALASLKTLVENLEICCENLNSYLKETVNEIEFRQEIPSEAENESDDQKESSDEKDDVVIEMSHEMDMALTFYKKGMDSLFVDKKEHFSHGQMLNMHFNLSKKINKAFPDENIDCHLLQQELDTYFEQCKQRNVRNLKGKAKQVENIIQKLKTAYNRKVDELKKSPNAPMRTSPESQLERILKVELWKKIGPTEPHQIHWDCLRSQVNLRQTFERQIGNTTSGSHLGIQMNYGALSMIIFKEGKYLEVKNEHGEGTTSTIVGVTKGRTLVYGSQVKRAEAKGNLPHKYHVGEHFEPTGDSSKKRAMTYELPLKTGVRQLGISVFLGFLFKKMKISAERQHQIEIQNCVITVPYYYTHCQRQEIKLAAIAAGFREVRVLSDTSAAALHFALFKIQESGSPLRTFRVLSENSGNFYGAVYRFYHEKGSLKMMVDMKRSFKDSPGPDGRVLTDEEKVRIVFAELTSQYNSSFILEEWERLNNFVLLFSESPRWEPILKSGCEQMCAVGITTSPIHDVIDLITRFGDQIKERLPHKIVSKTGTINKTSSKITSAKTDLFQKLYGTEIYPFGTLKIVSNFKKNSTYNVSNWFSEGIALHKSTKMPNSSNQNIALRTQPKNVSHPFYAGSIERHKFLQNVSNSFNAGGLARHKLPKNMSGSFNAGASVRHKSTRNVSHSFKEGIARQKSTENEPTIRKLKPGSHFKFQLSGKNLEREVPEVAPLIERFFLRSIEEVKKREDKSNESKVKEKEVKQAEIPKIKAKMEKRCGEMRSMMTANKVQLSDLITSLIEKVIKGSEDLAKKPNCTLEAVTAQLASLDNYYEKYFVGA